MISYDCYWYDWGGNIERGFPSYPKAYGSRCHKKDRFFSKDDDTIKPDCTSCKDYQRVIVEENRVSDYFMTKEEVAKYLNMSVHTLAKWRSEGLGPNYYILAGQTRYRWSDIQKYVAEGLHECKG